MMDQVEDWISQETLGDGKSGPCPGKITGSMGLPSQQWNGQLAPLLNTTIKGTIWCDPLKLRAVCAPNISQCALAGTR